MIETRDLQYFLAVAREQNITKAAESLHITQPSLSKQIKDLEDTLGKPLFIRGKKKTILTEEGALLRSKAEEILALIEKTESSFESSELVTGDICIGCAETPNIANLTKHLKKIHDTYPHIHYHMISDMADNIMEKLDNGIVDVAVMIEPVKDEKYNYIKLPYTETFGLLMKKDNLLAQKEYITIEDIQNIPLIMSDQRTGSMDTISWYKGTFNKLNIVATYNLIYNATFMVEQGLGSAYCLDNLVNLDGRDLLFKPFSPTMSAGLYLVTKKYRNLSTSVKLLLNMLSIES